MDYDPFDPDTHADPDPHFAALRASCPVHHHSARDFYTVARSEVSLRQDEFAEAVRILDAMVALRHAA